MTQSLQQKKNTRVRDYSGLNCAWCVPQYKPGNLSEFQEGEVYIAAKKTGQYKWRSF